MINKWEDWCRTWSQRASLHEELGLRSLDDGYTLTAADHLKRASVYYHFAKFAFVQDAGQMREAHMKAIRCKQLAAPFMEPPAIRVEIPFANRTIAGFLRLPAGKPLPSVMIMIPGLDSAKEELESYEAPFLQRGIATLAIDGPGQGEAEYDFPIRGDYEVVIKTVVDWLESQDCVDSSRIGLWGVSLGGYYAPRAVAFEKRIKACIALSGPFCLGDNWGTLSELSREIFRVRSHLATLDEARMHSDTLTLDKVAENIQCPLLLVAGKQDRLIDWRDAEKLAAVAGGPVTIIAVDDGNHIVNNRPYRYRHQTADWMAEQLRKQDS